jgi:hypothetical protein
MKTILLLVSITVFVLTAAALGTPQAVPGGQDQGGPLAIPGVQDPGAAPRQPAQTRTFEGELTKVDATAKTITVKGSEPNREMVFSYDDQTEVIGADYGVRGLAGNTGTQLKVSYRDQQGMNVATKIEIQPKKL